MMEPIASDKCKKFLNNIAVDHRFVGLEVLMSPFAANTYSQRLAMLASHLSQAMVIKGGEYPRISSGYENQIGEYEYNSATLENDATILAVIPKYVTGCGVNPIRENPHKLVIYRDNNTGICSYLTIDTYTQCMDGFGYRNKIINEHYLSEMNYVPGGTKFTTSPIHTDKGYGLGMNVNAVYLSLDGVTKDAFIISDELASKMTSLAIRTLEIRISPNQIPLNIYGNEFEYKFMPDIGEMVGEDSLIMCLRTITPQSYLTDMSHSSINTPQYLTDKCYTVPHNNATVIDIDVFVNYSACRDLPQIYEQINKYREGAIRYYTRIIETYNHIRKYGYPCSPTLQNLITTAYARLLSENVKLPEYGKRSAIRLVRKKDPIEFINIRIKYMYENIVAKGYKITNRTGAKGVVASIRPKEQMPVDDYGVRADIIVTPEAIPNRMIPSALYEEHINRTSLFVSRRITQLLNGVFPPDIDQSLFELPITADQHGAWNYFYEYVKTVNSNMCDVLDDICYNDEMKRLCLEDIIKDGIYLIIPPYLKHIDGEFILHLDKKFPAPISPVTFQIEDAFGELRTVRTKKPISIGSIYIYLLCKIPHLKSSGVAYTNQFKTPIQTNKEQKNRYPISQTPLRMGEDEVRNLIMAVGVGPVLRLIGLYANSTDGVQAMCKALLTSDTPSAIDRINLSTDYLVKTNNISNMVQHMFATIGFTTNETIENGEEVLNGISL